MVSLTYLGALYDRFNKASIDRCQVRTLRERWQTYERVLRRKETKIQRSVSNAFAEATAHAHIERLASLGLYFGRAKVTPTYWPAHQTGECTA